MRRNWPSFVLAAIALGLLSWVGYRAVLGWWFDAELASARREIASGDTEKARWRLERLRERDPTGGEIDYHLGLCEQAAGRPGPAIASWARIGPRSPYAELAAHSRELMLQQLHDDGQFAALEVALDALRRGSGLEAVQAGQSLARLLRFECRFDELRMVLREEWARSPEPYQTLQELWRLDVDPVPIAMVRELLDRAAAQSPDDDRVWLGRANLAIWSGNLEESERWLESCLERRPTDPVVWRAQLDWAIESDRVEEARRALEFLTPRVLPPARVLRLRAWLAARAPEQGTSDHRRDLERQALEDLLVADPGNIPALERLTALAVEDGDLDRAGGLRRHKAELDGAHRRYGNRIMGDLQASHLPELASLAETLGRTFEARAFLTLILQDRPDDPEARDALARIDRRQAAIASIPAPQSPVQLMSELGPPGSSPPSLPPGGHRPREAPGSRIVFTDDAGASGLNFSFDNGRGAARQLPETMSGGLGLLDYDGDDWMDVYVVQGGSFPPDPGRPSSGDRLFRNRGDGTFEDVTQASGLDRLVQGYGHGVTVADYNNDGWPDVFVTRWRGYGLYHNNGDKTFSDVTTQVGLDGDRDWPTSSAFADLDGDGDLDLYVCHYLAWDPEHPRLCPHESTGEPTYCDPRWFEALPDRPFRNDGGRFVDVTEKAGITATDGRGLGVVAADLDSDGRVDLYVANDTTANVFYRNLGALRFEEVGHESGLAGNSQGGYQAGMGIALGDLDGDGRPDLAVTNFLGEGTTYYQNLAGGQFVDRTADVGLMSASRSMLGFGIAFLDADNDGHLDLATANGHVNDYRPTFPYAMPAQLLRGGPGGHFADVSESAGAPWQLPRVGRGLAVGDLDNDGRGDLLILSQDGPLAYFHNRTDGGQSITFRLEGTVSNRDGMGARVTVQAGAANGSPGGSAAGATSRPPTRGCTSASGSATGWIGSRWPGRRAGWIAITTWRRAPAT
jgi:tetratricopeptide (TPR) repeat protein